MVVGGVVTVAVLAGAMGLILLGNYFPEKELLIFASLALAPVTLIAVMVGYAVWWLVLFLATLLCPDGSETSTLRDGPAT